MVQLRKKCIFILFTMITVNNATSSNRKVDKEGKHITANNEANGVFTNDNISTEFTDEKHIKGDENSNVKEDGDDKYTNAHDEIEESTYVNHPCKRECEVGVEMTCYYQFRLEHFYSMSKACYNCFNTTSDCFRKDCIVAGGFARPVIVINRMIPGPTIEVCYGDKVVVDLINHTPDQVATIHWHGHHQMYSPFMDGVPYVTQCPVLPMATFRYTVWATNCGTHWWHSHVGTQRSDGAYGAFIVKLPREKDPMAEHYDRDQHSIVLSDWSDEMSMDVHLKALLGPTPDLAKTILVNGLGPLWVNGTTTTPSPIHQINVVEGLCYRIRFIHAGNRLCPIEVYVDKHNFTVIATDGENVKHTKADSFFITNGERYDIVLCATEPADNYWIRFTGYSVCSINKVHQVAVLHYVGAEDASPSAKVDYELHDRHTMQVNPFNQYDNATKTVSINDLCGERDPCFNNLEHDPSLEEKALCQHIVQFDFKKVDHELYHHAPYTYMKVNGTYQQVTPQFDSVSFKSPSSNLFSQWKEIDKDIFCSDEDFNRCGGNSTKFCSCLHIIKVPLYCSAEIVLIDQGSLNFNISHPIHLHGYSFHVVSWERATEMNKEIFKKLDAAGKVKRHLKQPCAPARKDVISVPSPGYAVIRFWANNPGLWFMHCHVEPHMEVGMSMVVQVGEPHQWMKVPDGFPRCGDFNTDFDKEYCINNRWNPTSSDYNENDS